MSQPQEDEGSLPHRPGPTDELLMGYLPWPDSAQVFLRLALSSCRERPCRQAAPEHLANKPGPVPLRQLEGRSVGCRQGAEG